MTSAVFPRTGTKKLYTNLVGLDGKRRLVSTGLEDQAAAERWVVEREREIARERAKLGGATTELTVAKWIETWSDDQRDRGVVDWKRNRSWLRELVAPVIGDMLVRDVRMPHLVSLFAAIRKMPSEVTGKPRASRTIHNIHSACHAMFNDAERAGHIEHAPKSLDERELGRKKDADPDWREGAVFTRDEVVMMISSPLIPWDRRVLYSIETLTGARPSEAAALRWANYDAAKKPLGCMRISKSYSARIGIEKGTKTDATKHAPVIPTLAAILAEWKLVGWYEMMGRHPEADDLIVPLPPADAKARTKKRGEGYRPDYYSRRRWVESDEPALGWRHRRHYDTRATFITLAIDAGADETIIEERVTHTKPCRKGIDYYIRGERWAETCAEVIKLDITRPRDAECNVIPLAVGADAVVMQSPGADDESVGYGLRRRGLKAEQLSSGDARGQRKHDVTRGHASQDGRDCIKSDAALSRCDLLMPTLATDEPAGGA